jgi:hypothetical protein
MEYKTGKDIVEAFDCLSDTVLSFDDRRWLIRNIDETIATATTNNVPIKRSCEQKKLK